MALKYGQVIINGKKTTIFTRLSKKKRGKITYELLSYSKRKPKYEVNNGRVGYKFKTLKEARKVFDKIK